MTHALAATLPSLATPSGRAVPPRHNHALIPLWISGLYAEADTDVRMHLIDTLMQPVSVLGLLAVANGAFAALRRRRGWQSPHAAAEDAARIDADQIHQLADYVRQTTPETFIALGEWLARHPRAGEGTSGAMLLQALGWRPEAAPRPAPRPAAQPRASGLGVGAPILDSVLRSVW